MATEPDREHNDIPSGALPALNTPADTTPAPRPLVPGVELTKEDESRCVAPVDPTEPSDARAPQPLSAAPAMPETAEQIERQIQELEARLKSLLSAGAAEGPTGVVPDSVTRRSRVDALGSGSPSGALRPDARVDALGSGLPSGALHPDTPEAPRALTTSEFPPPHGATASELLSTDFYLRQWGRAGMRSRSEEVDEFGFDPKFEARYEPLFDLLYKHYFRTEVDGLEHIPSEGRCLLVSNHSGGPIPYDGLMLRTAVRREHPARRELRWLAEDFVYYLPFAGTFMNRLGAVRACQENAERLLTSGRLVAVFPEGVKGIGKLYRDRYQLQRFGRGGFIRLCLRTRTPLVPCAIVGAEETNPLLYRVEHVVRALGVPYVPITPTFPVLGPLGLVPAPTKWKIRIAEPLQFGGYGPEAADDEILVRRLTERVRATIQGLLDETLAARKSIWFG